MEDFTPNTHPVLANLNQKVADLESKVAKGLELDAERIQTMRRPSIKTVSRPYSLRH